MSLKPWLAALVILSAVLAGCASDESPEGETTQTNTSTTETETETQTQAPEAPQGTDLSRADIAAIAAVFTDQPLSSSQSPWPAHLLKWVNMADLMRIKGVGPEYAELLEAAGVDTVKELRNRNAANLASSMEEINSTKKLTRNVPAASVVSGWVDQAKSMDPKVTY